MMITREEQLSGSGILLWDTFFCEGILLSFFIDLLVIYLTTKSWEVSNVWTLCFFALLVINSFWKQFARRLQGMEKSFYFTIRQRNISLALQKRISIEFLSSEEDLQTGISDILHLTYGNVISEKTKIFSHSKKGERERERERESFHLKKRSFILHSPFLTFSLHLIPFSRGGKM